MALGCAQPFGVSVEEVSQRHVCFFTRETVGLLGHSRIKAKAKLHSDVIRRNRGSQRLPRFTLVVRLDVDSASSECLVGKVSGTVDLFMHILAFLSFMVLAVASVKSPFMQIVVRLCVDVRFVGCVTPSAVLAVDGFVGASGNSHHVKKDVGVLGLWIVHVLNRVAQL